MKKKTLISIVTLFAVILFGVSSFASNDNMGSDAVNGVRNAVGGAENVVEDAAKGIAGGIRDGISDMENGAEDASRTGGNNMQGAMTSDTNRTDRNYTATRTATTGTTNNTFLGMNETAWAWLIMAVVGIAIVALVWYYGKQNEMTANNHDDRY